MTKEIKLTENGEVSSSVVLLMKGCLFSSVQKCNEKVMSEVWRGSPQVLFPKFWETWTGNGKTFELLGPVQTKVH